MRGRAIIQQASLWSYSPVLFTALLSTAILCWWLAPKKLNGQDAAVRVASVDDNEMDAALQEAASEALGEREGAVIVMDAQTGRVRAVVNSSLAFEQAFSPGSTIKPFTALAGMRAGLIDEGSRLLCRERYVNGDFEARCSHPKIGAPFDPVQAIAYSCNYYFGKLGERLGEDSFDATLASFGFGAPTNVHDEQKAAGILPRGRWKISNALGEGRELLVTPIQLIVAYAALVNGGHLYTPQVARARDFHRRERASLNVAPAHRTLLIEGMRGAVTYGTAERAALSRLPLYLFGKTGTATASDGLHTNGWFIGFASEPGQTQSVPPERVELVVLVFLKGAHGAECAESARPIFEAFIRRQSEDQKTTARRDDETTRLTSSALPLTSSVRVYLASENKVVTVSFEDYVLGVLAAEGAMEDEPEALKALAVAIRTYALQNLKRHEREGYDFCSTTHCQRYTFVEGNETAGVSAFVRRAFAETAGEVLLDENGQVAEAYFHAACGGMTANLETLWGGGGRPYLRGVRDEYCASMPHREWTDVIPAARLAAALNGDSRTDTGARLENIIISRRDATGRAELITLDGTRRRVVRGWDFKIIVGRALGWNVLKSSRFEVTRARSNFVFHGSGFGHGVGLCQEGAHVMAHRGIPYRRILGYYFPGTSVGPYAREMNEAGACESTGMKMERRRREKDAVSLRVSRNVETWKADLLTQPIDFQCSTRVLPAFNSTTLSTGNYAPQHRRLGLASEHFQLSYPANVSERDAKDVLRDLEAARSDVLRRVSAASLSFDGPQKLDVIVHLTTGDFASATGQPWWAAAATKGRRIELQPLIVLRRRGALSATLRHEYAHAVIDALSRGRAPRWLSEGLAIHVAGEGAHLARFETKERLSTEVIEQRLALAVSAQEMRALYAAAYRQVQALVSSEGESSVWRRVAQRE